MASPLGKAPLPQTLPQTLRRDVQKALKFSLNEHLVESPFVHLTLYRLTHSKAHPSAREITRHLLQQALHMLSLDRPQEAKILELRFLQGASVSRTARELDLAVGTIYNKQRQAIDHLTQALWRLEEEAIAQHRRTLTSRLAPPTYLELVGVDHLIDDLTTLILAPRAPWLIALEGLGGIGKSALADVTMRHLLGRGEVEQVVWLTARSHTYTPAGGFQLLDEPTLTYDELVKALAQQLLPDAPNRTTAHCLAQLRTLLKAQPHVIVIDNLESVDGLGKLIDTLVDMANPTKFLLTSRTKLFSYAGIFHFGLRELSTEQAMQLVRGEAARANLPHLATADNANLQPIIETVGGHPLALRLVVSQTHIYTLDVILENLRQARGHKAENLYTFLYRQAWDTLNAVERSLLLIMAQVNGEGRAVQLYHRNLSMPQQIADLTGFRPRSDAQTDQFENLSGLATIELNSPDGEGVSQQQLTRLSQFALIDVGEALETLVSLNLVAKLWRPQQ